MSNKKHCQASMVEGLAGYYNLIIAAKQNVILKSQGSRAQLKLYFIFLKLNRKLGYVLNSSQYLKWITNFHQSCPKTKTIPILVLEQLLINFFDPLQMMNTVFCFVKYTYSEENEKRQWCLIYFFLF